MSVIRFSNISASTLREKSLVERVNLAEKTLSNNIQKLDKKYSGRFYRYSSTPSPQETDFLNDFTLCLAISRSLIEIEEREGNPGEAQTKALEEFNEFSLEACYKENAFSEKCFSCSFLQDCIIKKQVEALQECNDSKQRTFMSTDPGTSVAESACVPKDTGHFDKLSVRFSSLWKTVKFSALSIATSAMVLRIIDCFCQKNHEDRLLDKNISALDIKDHVGLAREALNMMQFRKDIIKVTVVLLLTTGMLSILLLTGGFLSFWPLSGLVFGFGLAATCVGYMKFGVDPGALAHLLCTSGEKVHECLEKREDGLSFFKEEQTLLREWLAFEMTIFLTLQAEEAHARTEKWYNPGTWFNGRRHLARGHVDDFIRDKIEETSFISYQNGRCMISEGHEKEAIDFIKECITGRKSSTMSTFIGVICRRLHTITIMIGAVFTPIVKFFEFVSLIPGVGTLVKMITTPFSLFMRGIEFSKMSITKERIVHQQLENIERLELLNVFDKVGADEHGRENFDIGQNIFNHKNMVARSA